MRSRTRRSTRPIGSKRRLSARVLSARVLCACTCWLLAGPGAIAAEGGASSAGATEGEAPDKSGYSLLRPVPDDKLRDFSASRPGKAQSSTTLDAGRFQLESDVVTYTYDPQRRGQTSTRAYSIGTPMLRAGITDNVEINVGLSLFNSLRQSGGDDGPPLRGTGFGDTLVGARVNLFGNEGDDQSFALVPFIKAPTAARNVGNNHVEFNLYAPYTVSLGKPWSLTLEPTFGEIRNDANNRYRQDYGFIANLSRPVLVEGLTAAAEVAVNVSSVRKDLTKVSFDPSLQYLLTKNLQVDVGVYLGLNKATPRYNPYAGVAYRF